MSNGFYNYIAKNTATYFQSIKDSIRPGERYCLRLDTEEMVANVTGALQDYARLHGIEGTYVYSPDYTSWITHSKFWMKRWMCIRTLP